MADFEVPRRYHAGLNQLLSYDSDLQGRFLDALAQEQASGNPSELIEHISSEVGDLESSDVDTLLQMLVGLYLHRSIYALSVDEVVEGILDSPVLELREADREQLRILT